MTLNDTFIRHLLNRFKAVRVLVIGDVLLDHYIFGEVERLSPEAPVPILTPQEHKYILGGAANVALNIQALNGQVELCGRFGQDAAGARLLELLRQSSIVLDPSLQDASITTILKTRILARNQQICRIDYEEPFEHYSLEEPALQERVLSKLDTCDIVLLSDYAKGVLSPALLTAIFKKAQGRHLPVCMDPKPIHSLNLNGLYLLTPNRLEALQMAGLPSHHCYPTFPAEVVCQKIWERYRPQNLVITLNKEGMIISQEGKVLKAIPTYAREVFDVSGAGDTVIASLTLALAAGASLEEASQFANLAAGVVIGKLGTATALPEEILAYEPTRGKAF